MAKASRGAGAMSGMPSSQHVDQLTREQKITLQQVRRVIPEKYLKPNAIRSWWALIRVLFCVAGCLCLLSRLELNTGFVLLWQVPTLIAIWVFYGWALVGLFVLGHDCGHSSFSRREWIDTLVGYICMSPLANSFHGWRVTHDLHHAHTQLRGQGVDWDSYLMTRDEFEKCGFRRALITRLGYALPFGIFLWIAWNTLQRGLTIKRVLPPKVWAKHRFKLLFSNLLAALCLATIYGGLWLHSGTWGMLKHYGIPASIAMVTGWFIIAIQHGTENSLLYEQSSWSPIRGQLVSTFDIRFPGWLEYLWCKINIHVPHHVAPAIPWYYLQPAARALTTTFPEYVQQEKVGMRHLRWLYRTPFLKRDEKKGYYVLDMSRSLPSRT